MRTDGAVFMHYGFLTGRQVIGGKRIMAVLLSSLLAVTLLTSCVFCPADSAAEASASEDFLPADIEPADSIFVDSEPADIEPADSIFVDSEPADTVSADSVSEGAQGVSGSGSAGSGLSTKDLPCAGLPAGFDRGEVPDFSGIAWADINDDIPFFSLKERETARRIVESGGTYQQYGDLDGIGRCTGACVLAGPETIPRQDRGDINMVKPTGWHTVKYDGIDGNYLYNRCHLIGFQLTGQNANEKNLITGTRFMNIEGMLPYENSVLAYIEGTGRHVLYRVTPVFSRENLLADGVLMEACSVEDPLVQFCAFCFNVQPGVRIDYATGESEGPVFTGEKGKTGTKENTGTEKAESAETAGKKGSKNTAENAGAKTRGEDPGGGISEKQWDYIVNVRSGIFHIPSCDAVKKISRKNRQGYAGTSRELEGMGYKPCGRCMP